MPRSRDFVTAGVLLSAAGVLYWQGPRLLAFLTEHLVRTLQEPPPAAIGPNDVFAEYRRYLEATALSVLPLMLLFLAVAVTTNIMQFGLLLSWEAVALKWERLNPVAGFQRIFSLSGLVRLSVSVLKMLAVLLLAGWFGWLSLPEAVQWQHVSGKQLLAELSRFVIELSLVLSAGLFVIALLDLLFQRWKYEQDIKMTRQEVRDEMKDQEGDPHIKSRRREAQQKLAQARQLEKVADADVVITNPVELAVAIKYDPRTMPAPVVVAKGRGLFAQRIREEAAAHGVPIIERKPLAQALFREVKVGQPIPGEMYQAFVEILAYVYQITGRTPEGLVRKRSGR